MNDIDGDSQIFGDNRHVLMVKEAKRERQLSRERSKTREQEREKRRRTMTMREDPRATAKQVKATTMVRSLDESSNEEGGEVRKER